MKPEYSNFVAAIMKFSVTMVRKSHHLMICLRHVHFLLLVQICKMIDANRPYDTKVYQYLNMEKEIEYFH